MTETIYPSEGHTSAACGAWEMPSGGKAHTMCPGYVLCGEQGPTECACPCHTLPEGTDPVIASMIAWLDEHQHDGMEPGIAAALKVEDPRTWAEVYAAGVVTDTDVIGAWLASQAHGQTAQHRASCGHPANEDGECDCSSWPERAPYISSDIDTPTG